MTPWKGFLSAGSWVLIGLRVRLMGSCGVIMGMGWVHGLSSWVGFMVSVYGFGLYCWYGCMDMG